MSVPWMRFGFVVLLLSAPSGTAAQQNALPNDQGIKAQAEQRLFDAGLIGVRVEGHDRNVTLSGVVPSLWLKDHATQRARKVQGVTNVICALTIKRAERDEPLAREVADKVNASTSFSIFDDVGVRVDDGVATLIGEVTTADKAAEMKASEAKLDTLVKTMNAATGNATIDAVKTVVNELARQHQAMYHRIGQMHRQQMMMMMGGAGMTRGR